MPNQKQPKTLVSQQSLAYSGWLGSINKIVQADVFVNLDTVQYSPKTWQNRNIIRTANGPTWLTIPVKGGREQTIAEVEIDNENNLAWRRKHLRSWELNYHRAKHFEQHYDFLKTIYSVQWRYLADFNDYVLRWVLKQLGVTVELVRASHLDLVGEGSDRVLDMCVKLNADKFIVGAGAEDYTPVEDFNARGIEVEFQAYSHPRYEQCWPGFEPGCCTLDLILNMGPDSLEILRGQI